MAVALLREGKAPIHNKAFKRGQFRQFLQGKVEYHANGNGGRLLLK
jgi:hypothetical protein